MLLELFMLLALASGGFTFEQHEYLVKFERGEATRHDVNYFGAFKIYTFKYNRTFTAVNITIKMEKDFGEELQIQFQAYRFASNEYRLFPLRYMDNLCRAIARNDYGLGNVYNCGSFAKCPIVKGHYFVCNMAPDATKFPPHIPNGSYKVEITFIYRSAEAAVMELYGTVDRPILYR